MSHELNLAITLPEQPLILAAAPVAVIVLLFAVKVILKRRNRKRVATAWSTASTELGLEAVSGGAQGGSAAQGKVNNHVVSIAPIGVKGRRKRISTQYDVKYEAPEAPKFRLVKRSADSAPIVDTGNPKFDAVVAVQTEQQAQLTRFLTAPRRAAILRLLTYWPDAVITNRAARLTTPGLEKDDDKLVDSICHLVATAETFDRPTPSPVSGLIETETGAEVETPAATSEPSTTTGTAGLSADVSNPPEASQPSAATTASPATEIDDDSNLEDIVAAARAIYEAGVDEAAATPSPVANELIDVNPDTQVAAPVVVETAGPPAASGETDLLTEVRLDEATVLGDLFTSGLDVAGIAARFEQVYKGRDVTWSGEVVRVGATDGGLQRIAALVGSADGENPDSGRVVALTAVSLEPALNEGDIVSFSGSLANLDASKRLFHVV